MTNLNIHRVKSVIIEDIKEQFSGSYVRNIIIKTEDGNEFEITLFSRKYEGLETSFGYDMEDWK
jgi:hypothetical protein